MMFFTFTQAITWLDYIYGSSTLSGEGVCKLFLEKY